MGMRIKKFVASTINEAMAMVRKELGEDAVVLKTEKLEHKSHLGLRSKTEFEITAATHDNSLPPLIDRMTRNAQQVQEHIRNRPTLTATGEPRLTLDPAKGKPSSGVAPLNQPYASVAEHQTVRTLKAELESLKGTVRELSDQLRAARLPDVPPMLAEIIGALDESGLEDPERTELIIECMRSNPHIDRMERSELMGWWIEKLATAMPVTPVPQDQVGQVVFVIGPTGVGKTTTLAKLATHHRFWGKRKVALCSIDTYRVAAIEQLRVFANIANIPMTTAFTPEELKQHVTRFIKQGFEAIFVDTPGRSPVDGSALPDLVDFSNAVNPEETMLLLSASSGLSDLQEQFNRYRELPVSRIIATKIDETSKPARWYGFCRRTARSISYWTVGQNVPDDIMVADPRLLVRGMLQPDLFSDLKAARFRLHAVGDDNANPRERETAR